MNIHSHRPAVRLTLEPLEDRCTPAGTVTGSFANGVWRLTGDNDHNRISVTSAGPPGAFTVSGDVTTTVAGVTNVRRVQQIVFDMKGGSDDVTVDIAKLSSMVFNGGDGRNYFTAQRFNVENNLRAINGAGGQDLVRLVNFKIGGNLIVNNGSGDSYTQTGTLSAAAGFNRIAGNVTVHNGAGEDHVALIDTEVGGNVTVHHGAGDGVSSGSFVITNFRQNGRQAVIGGSVTVTYLNGAVYNVIGDAIVRGDVTFSNGSGAAQNRFDGYYINKRVHIGGTLKIAGTGANLVSVGRESRHTGLHIVKNLVIDVKNPTDLDLQAFRLFVDGQTRIV